MENVLAGTLVFGLCMGIMSLGVILSGKLLKGSCGGVASGSDGKNQITDGCGFCVKKESNVCESSEENGELIKMATLGFPGKKNSH